VWEKLHSKFLLVDSEAERISRSLQTSQAHPLETGRSPRYRVPMGEDRKPTLVLCGSTLQDVRTTLIGRPYKVLLTGGIAPDIDAALSAEHCIALFDADALGPKTTRLVSLASGEANVMPVVVSRDTHPEQIVAVMRAGATDYVVRDNDGSYLADLDSRFQALLRLEPPQTRRSLAARIARLLHVMHHDVKNPVNNILGFAELLLEIPGTKLTGEQAKFAARIRENGNDVLKILKEFVEKADKLAEEQ